MGDTDFVQQLASAIRSRGKTVQTDREQAPTSGSLVDSVLAAIQGADVFAFVISPAAVTSQNCRAKLEHAAKIGKRLSTGAGKGLW